MNNKTNSSMQKISAVFFDCWDTLIRFQEKDIRWNILPLMEHTLQKENYDWNEIHNYCELFLKPYYKSHSIYEIDGKSMLNMLKLKFDIKLDCSLDECFSMVLDYLDPEPLPNITDFLQYLKLNNIYHAIISNTIYSSKDTERIIHKFIPNYDFAFLLASSEVAVKKPNTMFFDVGLSIANKKASESIYIGDAFLQDVCGSYNAGFYKSVWLNHKKRLALNQNELKGYKFPEYIEVSSYKELLDLFLKGKI